MRVRTALLELFMGSKEWRTYFRSCCEYSAFRLRSQAWQFCDELKERGHEFGSEEVEDALLSLARELLPDSPAGRWDAEWARRLCEATLTRINKRHASLAAEEKAVVDASPEADWIGQMNAAARANDPAAFRAAVKGWERAGLEAMEQVQIKGGAA
jgi:hypothetical protein